MDENKKAKIEIALILISIFPAISVAYVGFQIEWYYGILGIIMFIISSITYFKLSVDLYKRNLKQKG